MVLTDDVAAQALARAELSLGTDLDPSLRHAFKSSVNKCYNSDSMQIYEAEFVELELRPSELQPGMVLALNLLSGSGLLLLKRGIILDAVQITLIKRYYEIDPASTGVFVLVKR